MILFLRILRIATQNIYRNSLTSIVAIIIITLLFTIFNGILFSNTFQKTALSLVNSRLDLALNFTKDVDDFQVTAIKSDLHKTFSEIRDVNFISSEKAFMNFVKNFGETNHRLSTWLQTNTEESPLPATLVISVNADLHEKIIEFLDTSHYSELFNLDAPATGELAAQTANKIIALSKTLSRISFSATLIFSILATLIIVAVLRLAIFARETEIGIMRLVGATKQFIRLPFVIEGIFFGLTASFIGAGIFFFTLSRFDSTDFSRGVYGNFGEMLTMTISNFSENFILILGWQILAAIAIGTLASIIATHRYLTSDEVIFN